MKDSQTITKDPSIVPMLSVRDYSFRDSEEGFAVRKKLQKILASLDVGESVFVEGTMLDTVRINSSVRSVTERDGCSGMVFSSKRVGNVAHRIWRIA